MIEKNIGIVTFEMMFGRKNIGSSRIRGHWLSKYWNESEIFKIGKKYDTIIFQKSYWTDYAKAFKGIKIFDICDPDFMHWSYKTKEMIEECDAITTSMPLLAEAFKKFTPKNKSVICIPDRIDLEEVKEKKEHVGQAKWAVWFGYSNNFYLLSGIEKHLHKLGLGLIIVSDENYTLTGNYLIRILNIRWKADTANINIQKGDIALNPYSSKGQWKYKSNNKTLTAWSLGLPVANTPDDLKRFMDVEERKKEVELRQKELQEKWDVRQSVKQFQDLIKQIKKTKNASVSLS